MGIERVGDNETERRHPTAARYPTRRPATETVRSTSATNDQTAIGATRCPSASPEQVDAPKARTVPKWFRTTTSPQFGYVQNGVHVQVVLRGFVVVRKQRGPEDGQRAEPGVGEDDVAARGCSSTPDRRGRPHGQSPPAGCCAPRRWRRHRPAMDEPVVHRSCRSKRTASSGRAAAKTGRPRQAAPRRGPKVPKADRRGCRHRSPRPRGTRHVHRGAAKRRAVGPWSHIHRARPADRDRRRALLDGDMSEPGVNADHRPAAGQDVDRIPWRGRDHGRDADGVQCRWALSSSHLSDVVAIDAEEGGRGCPMIYRPALVRAVRFVHQQNGPVQMTAGVCLQGLAGG